MTKTQKSVYTRTKSKQMPRQYSDQLDASEVGIWEMSRCDSISRSFINQPRCIQWSKSCKYSQIPRQIQHHHHHHLPLSEALGLSIQHANKYIKYKEFLIINHLISNWPIRGWIFDGWKRTNISSCTSHVNHHWQRSKNEDYFMQTSLRISNTECI